MSAAPHPLMLAKRAVRLIEGALIPVTAESQAHDAIVEALEADGLNVRREVRLSDRDRVDVMCGPVAIEVKIGSTRRRSVYEQLCRYAKHDEVSAVVLATAGIWPANMHKVEGKPLLMASLSRCWL